MKSRFFFVYEWRFSTLLSGVCVASVLSLFYWAPGTFDSPTMPRHFSSQREFQGMVLLIILMSTYIVMSGFYSQRRSLELASQIDAAHGLNLTAYFHNFSGSSLIGYGGLGFIYAVLFNLPGNGTEFFRSPQQNVH